MKTTLEQLLLLEQSGELSPDQQQQLDIELAASPEARQQRESLLALARAIPTVEAEPAPDAAARIAARLQAAPTPARRSLFRPVWKPALAAAAALALLLGVRSYQTSAAPETDVAEIIVQELWTNPFETEFDEIDSLIATIDSGDWDALDDSTDFIEL